MYFFSKGISWKQPNRSSYFPEALPLCSGCSSHCKDVPQRLKIVNCQSRNPSTVPIQRTKKVFQHQNLITSFLTCSWQTWTNSHSLISQSWLSSHSWYHKAHAVLSYSKNPCPCRKTLWGAATEKEKRTTCCPWYVSGTKLVLCSLIFVLQRTEVSKVLLHTEEAKSTPGTRWQTVACKVPKALTNLITTLHLSCILP